MKLKCGPCTDQHIADGGPDPDGIPDAFTIVPVLQTFDTAAGQLAAPVTVPVCLSCRQKQLGKVSTQGLITA